jgi:hypothetical protein
MRKTCEQSMTVLLYFPLTSSVFKRNDEKCPNRVAMLRPALLIKIMRWLYNELGRIKSSQKYFCFIG